MTMYAHRLSDDKTHKMFTDAIETLKDHKDELNDYESNFYTELNDMYQMFGRDMGLSVKQLNLLRTIAWELEEGR